jgi:hypothetical protein
MLIHLIWLITCLIELNVGASRLMSSLALVKAFACLVLIFWSRWISLVECSRSSFALVVSLECRWGASFRWCWWEVSVGGPNQWGLGSILGPIDLDGRCETFSSRAKGMYLTCWQKLLPQTLNHPLKHVLVSNLLCNQYLNLICNNYTCHLIYGIVCLYVCSLYSRFIKNCPSWSWLMNPPFWLSEQDWGNTLSI